MYNSWEHSLQVFNKEQSNQGHIGASLRYVSDTLKGKPWILSAVRSRSGHINMAQQNKHEELNTVWGLTGVRKNSWLSRLVPCWRSSEEVVLWSLCYFLNSQIFFLIFFFYISWSWSNSSSCDSIKSHMCPCDLSKSHVTPKWHTG